MVNIIHKKSKTFIKEISDDSCFGEVAFFSGAKRRASARSTAFTEVKMPVKYV